MNQSKDQASGTATLSRREKLEIWREQRKQQQGSTNNSNAQKQAVLKETNGVAVLARSSSLSNMTNKENIGSSSSANSKHSQKMPLSVKSMNSNQGNSENSQATVPTDEYNNLKFKYRNLQKLHKSKMEYLQEVEAALSKANKDLMEKIEHVRSLKKSNEEMHSRLAETDDMCNDLAKKADELDTALEQKERLLVDFARDYIPRSDLEDALKQVEILQSEELESEEIICALKQELEECMEKLELLQNADSEEFFEQVKELNAVNMSLEAQLEQSCRDVKWKDQEVDQLKNALRETLSENAKLHSNVNVAKETKTSECQTSVTGTKTQEIETQTNFNFSQMIKETKFMAREYQNMKLGNDLMYQQLTQIQENSKKQVATLKEQIAKLEQQIMETERDKMDSLEMNQQLIQYHLEKDEKMTELSEELHRLQQQKSPDMDKIFTQAFSQAEQMAMTQIQEMMEKYEECERKLDVETAKCAMLESKIEQLLASDTEKEL